MSLVGPIRKLFSPSQIPKTEDDPGPTVEPDGCGLSGRLCPSGFGTAFAKKRSSLSPPSQVGVRYVRPRCRKGDMSGRNSSVRDR